MKFVTLTFRTALIDEARMPFSPGLVTPAGSAAGLICQRGAYLVAECALFGSVGVLCLKTFPVTVGIAGSTVMIRRYQFFFR